ncbi:unnamed protein product [Cochlearia groenlandica]
MVVDNADRISKGDFDISMATHGGRDNFPGEIIADGKDHLNRFRVDTCSPPCMTDTWAIGALFKFLLSVCRIRD